MRSFQGGLRLVDGRSRLQYLSVAKHVFDKPRTVGQKGQGPEQDRTQGITSPHRRVRFQPLSAAHGRLVLALKLRTIVRSNLVEVAMVYV